MNDEGVMQYHVVCDKTKGGCGEPMRLAEVKQVNRLVTEHHWWCDTCQHEAVITERKPGNVLDAGGFVGMGVR